MLLMQHFGTQDDLRAKQAARETTARLGAAVDSVFQAAFEIVGTTNANLVALKEDGITDPKAYDTMLKQMVEAQPNRFGAWLVWGRKRCADERRLQRRRSLRLLASKRYGGLLRDTIPREIIASDLYKVPYREHKPYLLEPHAINAVAGGYDARDVFREAARTRRDNRRRDHPRREARRHRRCHWRDRHSGRRLDHGRLGWRRGRDVDDEGPGGQAPAKCQLGMGRDPRQGQARRRRVTSLL